MSEPLPGHALGFIFFVGISYSGAFITGILHFFNGEWKHSIARIIKKSPDFKDFQVGYIAVNKAGETGAYSIHKGFTMMQYQNNKNENSMTTSEVYPML